MDKSQDAEIESIQNAMMPLPVTSHYLMRGDQGRNAEKDNRNLPLD